MSVARDFETWQIYESYLLINIFDRSNLIRPANGISVFQAAYGRGS